MAHIPERRRGMEKDLEETTMSWHWIKENHQAIILAARLQREGFDVKHYLRDYLNGEAKDPEHYWTERGNHG
jgi:hypothetical protein